MSEILYPEPAVPNVFGGAARSQPDRDVFRYEPRRLIADPVVAVNGWTIKPYRISAPVGAARRQADACEFPLLLGQALRPSVDTNFHGLGFAVLHAGRDGVYLLIGRWYAGHNLASDTYEIVTEGDPGAETHKFARLSLHACIWEMAVYGFERDAWVATMMLSGQKLNGAAAYLSCRTEGFV
ncbi:hypothetical protein [uncultured Bradyrhizobium sp.]|uniref:hypothetical protein n=1 Tax=uncultured Bradyrhizobium sp. TaxID=199684 RepID=UPI0035CA132D